MLYRDAISPDRERAIPADVNFQIEVLYSKDNVIYAVCAHNALEHPGLPVNPGPAPF